MGQFFLQSSKPINDKNKKRFKQINLNSSMEVLNYRTEPIASQSAVFAQEQVSALNSALRESSANQIMNNTIDAINQTLKQIVDKAQDKSENISSSLFFEDDWNILYFLRLLFYIVVVLKILDLVFSKRKKMDVKERVYRKYFFSYSEMIRQFDDDDRSLMNTTLQNTIKNASIDKNMPKIAKKTSTKKVIFHEIKNEYIQPIKKDQQLLQAFLDVQPLQMFLSKPERIEPLNQMKKDEEDVGEKQFTILQTIKEKKDETMGDCQKRTLLKAEAMQCSSTQNTAGQELVKQVSSMIKEQTIIKQKEQAIVKQKDL